MKQSNEQVREVKLIIRICEEKATKDNMTEQQKKDYIYKILMNYLENNVISGARNTKYYDNMKKIIPVYEKVYPDFSKEEFVRYVLTHTSNADIIFEEKLKLEKRLSELDERIASIDYSLSSEEDLRESSPDVFEDIDATIGSEIYFAINKQRLEEEKRTLQELKKGFSDICEKYDKRLPISLRGTKEQRDEFRDVGDEKKYNDIIETLTKIKNSTPEGENLYEKIFEYYKTFIGVDTKNWKAGFCKDEKGVAEAIFKVFVRCVPSFESYLESKLNDLKTNLGEIDSKIEKLYGVNREIEKRVIPVKKSPIKIEYYYDEDEGALWRGERKERKIEGEHPNQNLIEIEQKLENLINGETKKDPIKLNEELMKLYLKQVHQDDEGKYILQDMHDLFVSKNPSFKEYLQGWSNTANKILTKINELSQTKNDLSEQIHSYNVHYQSHPDGYSTEDHERF